MSKKKYHIKVGRLPFSTNAKAHMKGESHGFIKVILEEKTNKILGVHMIGSGVEELIGEASLALKMELNAKDIIKTLHVHPTLYEGFMEALRNALGKNFHLLK